MIMRLEALELEVFHQLVLDSRQALNLNLQLYEPSSIP